MNSNSATVQPLGDRSTNEKLPTASENNDGMKQGAAVQSMDYHRKALQEKLKESNQSQTSYVSPSDDIMSPCTKKLSDLKGKRFKNAGKPSSLFTKLGKKNFEKSSSAIASSPQNAN